MADYNGWKAIVVSDFVRDGLGVELIRPDGETVAEVFRSNGNHTVTVNTFGECVPLHVIEWVINIAREELHAFEDGSPLN